MEEHIKIVLGTVVLIGVALYVMSKKEEKEE